jgi:hypothetical protein
LALGVVKEIVGWAILTVKGKLAHVDRFPVESWISASKVWAPFDNPVASMTIANSPV